jgi:hypothetical protein
VLTVPGIILSSLQTSICIPVLFSDGPLRIQSSSLEMKEGVAIESPNKRNSAASGPVYKWLTG